MTSEKFKIKHLPSLIASAYKHWNQDNPWRISAVVAYYAVLALPGLIIILINLVGYVWGMDIVENKLAQEISLAMGIDATELISGIVQDSQNKEQTLMATIIGIGTLIFGATGVFYQLQLSLNEVWELKLKPKAGYLKLVKDRARGFGFVLVMGFLLLISFVLSALIAMLQDVLSTYLPEYLVGLVVILNNVISLGVVTVLFALIFKFLPDAKIKWNTVWLGAFFTSLLFALGKWILSLYFGNMDPGSAYGAAGFVITILLWVSYSCLILFFGAEFTWVYAQRYGHGIRPSSYAQRVRTVEVELDESGRQIKQLDQTDENSQDITKKESRSS